MSGTVQKRCRRGHNESIFYRDLRATTKLGLTSSSPSPWPHGFGAQDPPPPPVLSLEEFVECSPTQVSSIQSPGDVPQKQSSGLLTLPPPSPGQAVPPVIQPYAPSDAHGWITVYGFSPRDTNLVLREFEKCGAILKHVPGPSGANWMHILYENNNDAQKALQKNGTQISAALIVGVKPVDLLQHQSLTEKVNTGFMTLPLRSSGEITKSASSAKASSRPYYLQQPNEGCQRLSGAMASPSKSIISRLVDLIFGI